MTERIASLKQFMWEHRHHTARRALPDDLKLTYRDPQLADVTRVALRLKQALEIIRPMKMDNLKLMVDLFHMAKQGDDFQYLLDICKDWIVHVHFAEIEGRVYPIEANKKQYENIIRQMVEHGYRGRISVEAHAPNMKQDLPAAYTVLSECVKEAVENGK